MIPALLAAGLIGLGVAIALLVVSALAVDEYNRATSQRARVEGSEDPVRTGLFVATAVAAIFGLTAFSFIPIIGYIIGFSLAIAALTQLYRVARGEPTPTVQVVNAAVLAGTVIGAIGFLALSVYAGVADPPPPAVQVDATGAPARLGWFDALRAAIANGTPNNNTAAGGNETP